MGKMIQCKTCSREIDSNAKYCPGCGAKNKKAIYKRPWFIIVVGLVVVGAIGGTSGSKNSTIMSTGTDEVSQSKKAEDNISTQVDTQEKSTQLESSEPVEKAVPTEYKSALVKAKLYSDTMNMSKVGVYDQLTSEYGEAFSQEAAQYAIDNVEADWKKNALEKAKTYQESMAMSPSAIYDQLISEYGEKFTEEEAQYAIDNLE